MSQKQGRRDLAIVGEQKKKQVGNYLHKAMWRKAFVTPPRDNDKSHSMIGQIGFGGQINTAMRRSIGRQVAIEYWKRMTIL